MRLIASCFFTYEVVSDLPLAEQWIATPQAIPTEFTLQAASWARNGGC